MPWTITRAGVRTVCTRTAVCVLYRCEDVSRPHESRDARVCTYYLDKDDIAFEFKSCPRAAAARRGAAALTGASRGGASSLGSLALARARAPPEPRETRPGAHGPPNHHNYVQVLTCII